MTTKTQQAAFSMQFLRDLGAILRPYRLNYRHAIVWILAMQALSLVEPFLVMSIIDDVNRNGLAAQPRVIPLAAAAFFLLVITTWVKILKDRRIRRIALEIDHDLPLDCQRKLLRLPLAYHQTEHVGEVLSSVHNGTNRVRELVWLSLYELIPIVAQTLVVTIAIAYLHWSVALIVMATMMIFFYVLIVVKNRWVQHRRDRHEMRRSADKLFSQSVLNVMTVQAYGREPDELSRTADLRTKERDMFYEEVAAYDRSNFIRNAFMNFARVSVIAFSAYLVFGRVISLGQIVFASMLTERLFNACFQMGGMYDRVIDTVEPVLVMTKLLAEKESVGDPSPWWVLNPGKVDITLDQVTYVYPNRPDDPALRDVSITIPAGAMVGIVGESGHGKSTLAKLLLRFDDPTVGTVRFNDIDLRQAKKADVRRLIGYVPQEVELFDDTIAANIRYGRPEATDADVRSAARMANAHVFIDELPEKFDTHIGSRGLRLSGGQRQRIGIARAILTDPSVMIFDEATSSVDPETIYEIKSAMRELRKERTLIVITHQISTIQDADFIVVLKNGRVDGKGTHAELLKSNGVYLNFVRRQQNSDAALHVASGNIN
jgi:ATP-binding cassette subfamily B protein